MRQWGAGLIENEVGGTLESEWSTLGEKDTASNLQPYLNTAVRWATAWRQAEGGGSPHAWIALVVLEASVGYCSDDLALTVLAAIDRGDAAASSDVAPEHADARRAALLELKTLLAKSLSGDGTEDDLRRIAALGRS